MAAIARNRVTERIVIVKISIKEGVHKHRGRVTRHNSKGPAARPVIVHAVSHRSARTPASPAEIGRNIASAIDSIGVVVAASASELSRRAGVKVKTEESRRTNHHPK